jgi:hypothetical protein
VGCSSRVATRAGVPGQLGCVLYTILSLMTSMNASQLRVHNDALYSLARSLHIILLTTIRVSYYKKHQANGLPS